MSSSSTATAAPPAVTPLIPAPASALVQPLFLPASESKHAQAQCLGSRLPSWRVVLLLMPVCRVRRSSKLQSWGQGVILQVQLLLQLPGQLFIGLQG